MKTAHSRPFLFVALTLTAALAGPLARAQEPPSTRRVTGQEKASGTQVIVNEVNTDQFPKVLVIATVNKDGKPVKGLAASDFRVREDEVDQEPLTVEPKLPPLSVVVTLDTSGSMKKRLAEAQAAANSFLDNLSASDSAQVVSFAQEVKRLSAMSTSRETAKGAVSGTVARGNTALYDALHASLELLQDRPGRKAVVLLSDGMDDDGSGKPLSKHKIRDVLTLARQTSVPIYVIGLGTELDEAVLQQVAGESGGLYFNAPQASELKQLYAQIGEQLAGQYSISYNSDLPPGTDERTIVLAYGDVRGSKAYTPPKLAGPAATASPKADQKPRLPAWIPIYPGAEVSRISLAANAEKATLLGSFYIHAKDDLDAVTGYYRTHLQAAGWEVNEHGAISQATHAAGRKLKFSIDFLNHTQGKGTRIEIRFEGKLSNSGEGTAAPAEATPWPNADQKPRLPAWIPIYPGAEVSRISLAANAEKAILLGSFYIHAKDDLDAVTGYYRTHLQAAGWTVNEHGAISQATHAAGRKLKFSIDFLNHTQGKGTRIEIRFEGPAK